MARAKDDTPKGGWKGPPDTTGLAPIAIAKGSDKKGNWIWDKQTLTSKQLKKHAKFNKKMAKADKKDTWRW